MEQAAAGSDFGPYRAEEGFEFPVEAIAISADEQRPVHGWCGIEPEVYGDAADPTFVARRSSPACRR